MISSTPSHAAFSSAQVSQDTASIIADASHDHLMWFGNQTLSESNMSWVHIFECIYWFSTRNILEQTKDQPVSLPTHQDAKPSWSQPLIMPNPAAFYNQDEFEDVPFWTLWDWRDFLAAPSDSSSAQSISKKTGFLTDGDGNKLTKSKLKQIGKIASEAFNELYNRQIDPLAWGSKLGIAHKYFSYKMQEEFEEFRMCNDDWKAKAFTTLCYPDWCDLWAKGNLPPRSYIVIIHFLLTFFQVMSLSNPKTWGSEKQWITTMEQNQRRGRKSRTWRSNLLQKRLQLSMLTINPCLYPATLYWQHCHPWLWPSMPSWYLLCCSLKIN